MNKLILTLMALSMIGCNKLSRLTDGGERTPPPAPLVIIDTPQIGALPDFGIGVPSGRERRIIHMLVPDSGLVASNVQANDIVRVFIKDVGQWFVLGPNASGAYYYQRTDKIVIVGQYKLNKEIVVYIDKEVL